MESPIDDLVNEAINEDNCNNKCTDIAKYIQSQSLELLTLVEKLGPVLTDNEPERRKRGIHVLADVMQNLPQEYLQETYLIVMSNFFCDRLKDNSAIVIPPVLQGIFALVQMTNLPRNVPVKICTAMFASIQCQTLQQAERNTVYKIVQVSIQRSVDELKLIGPDFVYGVITMIDGERDPRNLLLLFGMLPHFLRTFPLGHLTEEMFEVIACYFPIDYYSKPDDPNAISRDELADALLPCLAAVPEFAEHCLPLLMEKIDSELVTAKLDSFKALKHCCSTFTIEGMEKFLYELASMFHRELIPGKDKKVCEEALAALTQLIRMLSTRPVDKSQALVLNTVLEKLVSDIKPSLQDVQFSMFLPAVRMVLAICQGSSSACQSVCTQVVPILLTQYRKGSNTEGKVVLLQTLSTLLAVCEEQDVAPRSVSELVPLWAEIFTLYLEGSQHNNHTLRKEGIHGFRILARSLNEETRPLVYNLLCKYVKEEDSALIRQETVLCLKELSKLFPDEVMEKVVFSDLHCSQESGDACDPVLQSRCMDALCEIAVVEPFTTCVIPQILDFVSSVPEISRCSNGIKCLRKLVELPDAGPRMHRYLYVQCAAVSRLVSWWLHGIHEGRHPEIFHNELYLIDSAKFLSTVLRTQTESIQYDVVAEFTSRFLEPGTKSEADTFRPLEASAPWTHTQSVLLLEALLSPIKQNVNIPQYVQLMKKLQMLAVHSSHELTSKTAQRFMACLINKSKDDESLDSLLSDLTLALTESIDHISSPNTQALNAVNLFSWITKALVMRGHKDMDVWVQTLLEFLGHQVIGGKAADGFRLIMTQEEEYLNMDNFCNIRLLYRQRFFQIVPRLVEFYQKASENVKSNFLVALAFLLQGAPRVTVNSSLPEMVPLLVESLGQKEVILLLTSLGTLDDLLQTKQPILEEHVNTFLPRFLVLTRFKESMKVRIKALQCVLRICSFPTQLILPFKHETLQELGHCLDDPKRLVRRQAVVTRSRWFLVGAPGEPQVS